MDEIDVYHLWQILDGLVIRRVAELDSLEVSERTVQVLALVGIEAVPEERGILYPYPGGDPVDDSLSQMIEVIVMKRFSRDADRPSAVVPDQDFVGVTQLVRVFEKMSVRCAGALSEAERRNRICRMLSVLGVADSPETVTPTGPDIGISARGRAADDVELIELVVELMRRRYAVQ